MTKTPRWMKSVIAASTIPVPALPWARSTRCRPAALKLEPIRDVAPATRPIAAH